VGSEWISHFLGFHLLRYYNSKTHKAQACCNVQLFHTRPTLGFSTHEMLLQKQDTGFEVAVMFKHCILGLSHMVLVPVDGCICPL